MNEYRTHTCGQLRKSDVGARVKLSGWVDTIRDHGGVIFVDLRDYYGKTQIVLNDESIIKGIPRESVVTVEGDVRLRSSDTVNPKIETGEVELKADTLTLISKCQQSLPFEIDESLNTREDIRLKYRFLDLRNERFKDTIILRGRIIKYLRDKMEEMGFVDIQTPILTASSPEGARDYLVPSRKYRGMFYALPQAPQQFKQLLMVSGIDKYYQIAPCFRDEDSRADRSPGEFYQLDFEMAFATSEDVFKVAEEAMYGVFTHFSNKKVSKPPFTRIPYAECMMKYGTDKPDLRNPLIITDLTGFFSDVDFAPFKGKPVRGIKAEACADKPRSFFEKMLEYATGEAGMKGLGYISIHDNMELKGPIVKFLSDEKQKELIALLGLGINDTLFFISDSPENTDTMAGLIRSQLGKKLNLIADDVFEFCFVTDYPMYGINDDTGAVEFTHNPFSMPQGGMNALLNDDPLTIKAWQYDIVVNGVELSSGAVRNHSPEIMEKAFEIAGYTKEDLIAKFPALYNAFLYGAPPHAGMAPGLDRIVMLIAGKDNIRDVVAFPMNAGAQDLLLGAPCAVSEKQLREAHIKIR